MEAKFLPQTRSSIPSLPLPRHMHKFNHSPILAVLVRTPDSISEIADKNTVKQGGNLTGLTRKTVPNDNWFEQLAISHLSNCVQAATGK